MAEERPVDEFPAELQSALTRIARLRPQHNGRHRYWFERLVFSLTFNPTEARELADRLAATFEDWAIDTIAGRNQDLNQLIAEMEASGSSPEDVAMLRQLLENQWRGGPE